MHNSDMDVPGSLNGSSNFEHNQTLNGSIITKINVSVVLDSDNSLLTEYSGSPPRDPPIPLLIASSVAAIGILIFICLAYYCHSLQLDSRARQLAVKLATKTSFVGVPPSTPQLPSCRPPTQNFLTRSAGTRSGLPASPLQSPAPGP